MANFPSYPTGLPYAPERSTYEVSRRHQGLVTTEMEDGNRQRSSATAAWSEHAYVIVMTDAQFELFDRFVMQTLGKGASRFYMPVGRNNQPRPWGLKLAYIKGGDFSTKPHALGKVSVAFVLSVLDW